MKFQIIECFEIMQLLSIISAFTNTFEDFSYKVIYLPLRLLISNYSDVISTFLYSLRGLEELPCFVSMPEHHAYPNSI